MSFKQVWQSIIGTNERAGDEVKSLVTKDERRPGETAEEQQRRQDDWNSVSAATNP